MLIVALALPVKAGPISVGIKFSDGSAASQIAGGTIDGCSNWVDSFTVVNGGFINQGYNGLACGNTTLASGVITCQWNSSDTFEAGNSSTSNQDFYLSYLDDGNNGGCNVNQSGPIGVSVTFSGISKWLAGNYATRYQMRLYCSSTWNLSQMLTSTPVAVRLGAPNPSNGSTQLTSLAVLETVQMQWLGDGGYPTTNSGSAARGYGDSSSNLSNDTITITIPWQGALSNQTRGSLAGIKLTPANAVTAPTGPLLPYEQTVTNDFPLAYWRLNETNGTVAFDYFGNYNGAVGTGVGLGFNGPQDPPFSGFGTNNTAMVLSNIANSYLTMPTFNLNTNAVTITGWINPSGIETSQAGVVFCRSGTTAAGVNFTSGSNNELRYTWNGARNNVSTGLIAPTNQWSFFALVVTPSGATLYLGTNGVLNSFTDNVSETNQAFDAPLLIGYDSGGSGRAFTGGIAEVALYRQVLTPAQIELQYINAAGCLGNPSITGSPTNLTVYSGTNATFSASATGPTVLSYQWQVSTNGGANFANVSGATNTSYTTLALFLPNSSNEFRMVANGLCGSPATSAAATVTVIPPPLDGYGAEVTNFGPVVFWRLNETNGASIAYDYFGNNNGTINAGVTAGVSGPQNPPLVGFSGNNTAMLLNGTTTSYLTMPIFNFTTNVLTMTGWMDPSILEPSSAGVVFCRGGQTGAGVNFSGAVNNELQYSWGSRYGISTGLFVPTNQWSFFALVVSSNGATLYVGTNGVLRSYTDVYNEDIQDFNFPLSLGFDASSGSRLFSGKLADVAIYNYSLTPSQIQLLLIAGAGCPGSPTITTNPVSQVLISGSSASFTVAATGPTPLSYQWQVKTNGGAAFLSLSGATNPVYTTPLMTVTNSGSQYEAVVSGLCGTAATSTVATLTVNPPPPLALGAQAVTNDNALAYWRMNEPAGSTVAYDFFGNYNGVIGQYVNAGVPGPQSPQFSGFETNNTAMQCNGYSGSALTMPTFNLNTNTVSISGWINPTGLQVDYTGIVFCRSGSTIAGLNFNNSSTTGTNELRYTWNGVRYDVPTGLTVPTNQWSFFALVVTPTGATLYLGTNGVLNSFTDNFTEPNQPFDASLLVGYDSVNNRQYNGRIDEVALYNHSLTPAQVQLLYIGGAGCPGSPVITTNPVSQTVIIGAAASFTVAATAPTLFGYQWQISTNNSVSFANLAGATNSLYTTAPTTLGNSGTVYRAVVTGLCGTPATSASAVLSVTPPPPVPAYAQAVSNDNAIAYWRLNETNGVTAYDFFGVNNGTIESGVIPGIKGPCNPPFVGFETNNTAMGLNGSNNSYLQMPTFNLNTNTVTISGWINPTGPQSDSAGIVFCRGGTTTAGVNFGPVSSTGKTNELQYTWGNRYDIGTGLIVPTNQWTFFAVVITPNAATVYMGTNGVLNSFTDLTILGNEAFDAPLLLGYDVSSNARMFQGGLDEIALFNRSLTPAQIQSLYIAGAGCPGSPSITTNPVNQTVLVGAQATFAIAATGPTLLSYQWQASTNGGASFAGLSGATNAFYTTPSTTLASSGTLYQAVVSGLCGAAATSTVASLTVNLPPPLPAYVQFVTNAQALAYWRLNETNGVTAYDYFGNYNGTIEPGVTIGVAGPRNPPFTGFETNNDAMLLNGGSLSYLSMPQFNNLNSNIVTITGWINPSGPQADYTGVVFCRNGSSPVGLNFGPGSSSGLTNELQYTWGNRYGVSTHLTVPINQWSFFALVVSPNGATIYLETNGVMNSSTDTTPEPVETFGAPLVLGSDLQSNLRYFKGGIDEVALFTNALSAVQLEQMAIAGTGCPGNPTITTNPANQTVIAGSTASFTVAATGPTMMTIQWQVSTNGVAPFANITAATNATYTTDPLSMTASGSVYRAVVTGLCGTPATSLNATLIVSPAPVLAGYPQTVTNNSPLAYWRLNETNGATVAVDFFGVNNGTINAGAVPGVPGPQNPPFAGFETNNTAVLLNGGSLSYLTMPQFNLNTNTVTVTGWINPSAAEADWTGVTFWRGGSTVAGLNFGQGSSSGITNELQYTWGNRFGVSTHLTVPTNQWSFFALVVTPNSATIYLEANGVLNSYTDTTQEPSLAFDSPLYLGYDISSTTRLFKGSLDEIALYTHALTPSQIQQFYVAAAGCAGNPTVTTNPVNQTVIAGATATFTVGATGPTSLAYQWQSSTNGGATFTAINGATNTNYTTPITTLANNGTQYQVVITGLCGSPVTSATATLTVNSVASTISVYAQAVSNTTPVAYWRLNEPNGATVAHDFFGVNNGTIEAGVIAGVAAQPDPPFTGFETNKTAMQLNGTSSSYLQMPTLNLNTNTVTITGWINPAMLQADWAGVAFCRSAATTAGVNFGPATTLGSNVLGYTWGTWYNANTGLIVPTNQWSFFALVVTPTGATMYLGTNGVLNSYTDTTGMSTQAFDGPLLLGYDTASGTRMFKGLMDEVAVYNYALTPAQIQQFYITGAGCPGGPIISIPPATLTVPSGSTATFTVTASCPTPMTYQWQGSTNGGGAFFNFNGATNASYTTPPTSMANNGTQYRVVVSGVCGAAATSAAATLFVELSAYAESVVSNAPVAYWRLNETNGASIAYDFFGVYNGTIESGVTGGVPGPQSPMFMGFETNNTAMQLNGGGSSYLMMPTFNLNTNTVTIAGWINPNGLQGDYAAIVFCRSGSTAAGLNFNAATTTGTNILHYTWNGIRYDTETGLVLPQNQWSFFALVVTPNGATVYLGNNGSLSSYTDALPQPVQAFDNPLLLGHDLYYGRPFNGGLDEVALYNYSLSPSQIQQLYTSAGNVYVPPVETPYQQWQFQYFSCTNCPQAAAGYDADGTGQDNLIKFLTGANPTNPASYFHIISETRQGNGILITWMCGAGRTNAVQTAATNTNPTNYTDISGPIVLTGSGDVITNYLAPGAATNNPASFYRIRLVP